MNISFLKKIRVEILLFILIIIIINIISSNTLFAQVMQSNTYKMMSDSINAGGEDSSNSSNYMLGDTLGEIGTGDSNSNNYFLHAGFWQMQKSYIAITSPADLELSSIGGITGEASEGTLVWQVTTDNFAGYSMNIKSASTPALTSLEDSFDDYTPTGSDPDYNFSIASTTSAFGFSPEGIDTSTRFLDNGSICNSGSGETSSKCWDGLSTTSKTIFQRNTSNHEGGSTATVRFRAESGADHIQTSGAYSAPIIVTAITL
ncbi:MAG: hypothetical protein UR25_C0001G0004 [Candidatus Nomurabacteria bacterium GW2011_GWE1_32_28]|uniref:Uncharacterized protein n=1 Tax=Candidatus Nomurabacteria bacterium GW2011_GWF1_31_48 TaxID=1618767 RepID=A0A0F9YU38_9BACT|nr:MAG: hypothetical protein UR10_C0005G0044 [Candidatus Nomurabacteria bacterium GW2011_GWF2_30_133]KKP28396.1 MAG: hypothetical protein UR18_C0005G0044 [Candidatus Nomurabacteria bacterium GW2011_GWE2_31_40]KKP29981.1 MAG: hypothetical protein UR19_C0006G0044 [Candidatus Nomurabacteria bacterium GW2011_GWF1_31_48]KKP35092.1 MAG: hypothetical protein UR25_C0001G0004 [Candidatus Nomurabacteria bacterium GW2011_GWE1_32_28]HAS80904.1 hypothetical protein [Candidatus Nomurabacteria bacterium]